MLESPEIATPPRPASRVECPRCKAQNPETARFCNHCAVDLAKISSPAPATGRAGARKVCAGCTKPNAPAAVFCHSCGAKLPVEATVPAFGEAAGFWIRVLASVIDAAVLWGVTELLESRLGLPQEAPSHATTQQEIAFILPLLLLWQTTAMLYETVFVGTWSGTIGKLVLGLRVIRSDGKKPTYGLSFMRWVGSFFSLLPLGLGYLWVAMSPSKRAWHDYLCDTRVVYKKPS